MKTTHLTAPANCPFYGRALFRSFLPEGLPFVLIPVDSSQCGLSINRHTPCIMANEGQPPDWALCPVFRDVYVSFRNTDTGA